MMDYINEARFRKRRVSSGNTVKIQDVAEAVGYRNITSFNRMFKKYTGSNLVITEKVQFLTPMDII